MGLAKSQIPRYRPASLVKVGDIAPRPPARNQRVPCDSKGYTRFDNGFAVNSIPTKMDANGKAAGSVEVKVFNEKVCVTADSSY